MPEPIKTAELYGGKVKIDFYEGTYKGKKYHYYCKFGSKERLTSVTSCTGQIDKSGALLKWSEKLTRNYLIDVINSGKKISLQDVETAVTLHDAEKKEAADLGSAVHAWAESYIKHALKIEKEKPKIPTDVDSRIINGILAFLKWVDQEEPKFIWTEKLVYSKKHDYVGLMDLAFTLKRERHKIIHAGDIKTSNGLYNEYRYQVSAYQEAEAEESGRVYGTKWLMRFSKDDGDFDAHEYTEHEKDFKVFLALLTLKKREKELAKF